MIKIRQHLLRIWPGSIKEI